MVNAPRRSTPDSGIPLRAAGIRRRNVRFTRTRLPVARRLFMSESDAPFDPSPSPAFPSNRPLRNSRAAPPEEHEIEESIAEVSDHENEHSIDSHDSTPNYSPVQDSSAPDYSPVRTPDYSPPPFEGSDPAPIDLSPSEERLSDQDVNEILDYLGSEEFLGSLIDFNNNNTL